MLERNEGILIEFEKLEKGGYTGQTVIHWSAGIVKILDIPKKPVRKEIRNIKVSNKVGSII